MLVFAIEYNCVLFENKREQMEGLLKNTIDSNICAIYASLNKIFKTIEFRDENGSYHRRYKIPREVFWRIDASCGNYIRQQEKTRHVYIQRRCVYSI